MERVLATLCLFLVLVDGTLLPGQIGEHGAIAPENRWHVRGGSTSRSGESLTRPITCPVREVWRFPPGGEIVGEPLVWDDQVLLEVEKSGKRFLQMVRLSDGTLLAATRGFKTTCSLAPCIWNQKVVFRSAPDKLAVFRMDRRRLVRTWTIKSDKVFGEPLFLGREIYVRAGEDEIRRYNFGRTEPVWKARGTFRSELALRGDSIYVVHYKESAGYLVRLNRVDGKEMESLGVVPHGFRMPTADSRARIRVGTNAVFLRHRILMKFGDGTLANGTRVVRRVGEGGRVSLSRGPPMYFAGDEEEPLLAPAGRDWLGKIKTHKKGVALVQPHKDNLILLASKHSHLEMTRFRAPPTIVRGTAYVGSSAIDLHRSRLLWRSALKPTSRIVPAHSTLLCVVGGRFLVALRARPGADRAPALEAAEIPGGPGIAHLRSGEVVKGVLQVSDGRLIHILPKKEPKFWPLSEVLILESQDGTPLYHGTQEDVIRFVNRLIEAKTKEGYADLAVKAVRSNDSGLIGRLLGEAWLLGSNDTRLRVVERKQKRLMRKPLKIKADVVADVGRREAALPAEALESVWKRAKKLKAACHVPVKIGLLKAILDRNPDHPGAVQEVKAMLPLNVDPGAPFQARDWLDFIQAVNETPITILEAKRSDPKKTPEQVKLLEARYHFKDENLVGIQSKRLFIISSLARPGRIARTLSMGELVCDKLASMFAAGRKKRMQFYRLLIYLDETQEDYLRNSGGRRAGSHIRWSAGHYSPGGRYSRMYIPEGMDAFKRVQAVFAHELTHQWSRERCPLVSEQEVLLYPGRIPGYWIEEGMASMMEEFVFDTEFRRILEANPRSETVDLLGGLLVSGEKPLVPWPKMFSFSHAAFARKLSPKPDPRYTVNSRWQLGEYQTLSPLNLFYKQATAACRYLYFAEKGKYRKRLIRYVADHQTGKKSNLSIEKEFGLSAEELGRRVEAYIKEEFRKSCP